MSKLRVHAFSISLDGYGAGPRQSLENPLGEGGERLHDWFIPTRTFQQVHGDKGGVTGTDDEFAARGFEGLGAWIMGRNMFGQFAVIGRMTRGKVGGEKALRITRGSSSSLTMLAHHSRWMAAPSSAS